MINNKYLCKGERLAETNTDPSLLLIDDIYSLLHEQFARYGLKKRASFLSYCLNQIQIWANVVVPPRELLFLLVYVHCVCYTYLHILYIAFVCACWSHALLAEVNIGCFPFLLQTEYSGIQSPARPPSLPYHYLHCWHHKPRVKNVLNVVKKLENVMSVKVIDCFFGSKKYFLEK